MLCDSRLSGGNVELQHISHLTTALVFLGTPHRGSGLASRAKIASSVAAAALFDVQKSNLRHLDTNGEGVSQLETSFGRLVYRRTFKIHSFQESKGMASIRPLTGKVIHQVGFGHLDSYILIQVVEDGPSPLGDTKRERVEPINANHMDMCRFVDSSDPGYQQVGIHIQGIVEEAQCK